MPDRDIFEQDVELPVWILRFGVTTLVIIFIYIFTWQYLSGNLDIAPLEQISLENRLLYSPDCLAYSGDNIQPGIIDINKFEINRLTKCSKKSNYAFSLILYDMNKNKIKEVKQDTPELQFSELCGSVSSINCISSKEYVLINDQNQIKPGILEVITIKNV